MNQLYLAWPNSCFYKHNSQCSHERGVSTEINPFSLVVGEERSGSVCRSSADQRSHHVNCQHRRVCSKIIFWPQIQCSEGPPKTCEKINVIQNKQAMFAPISSAISHKAKFPKNLAENVSKVGFVISKKELPWPTMQWRGSLMAVSGSGLSPVPPGLRNIPGQIIDTSKSHQARNKTPWRATDGWTVSLSDCLCPSHDHTWYCNLE